MNEITLYRTKKQSRNIANTLGRAVRTVALTTVAAVKTTATVTTHAAQDFSAGIQGRKTLR